MLNNINKIMNLILIFFIKSILFLRYKIKVKGLKLIKPSKEGILFLPNHPALIDPVILFSKLFFKFKPQPLAAQEQLEKPPVNFLTKGLDPIPVPDLALTGKENKNSSMQAINSVIESLKNGKNVVLYPSGRIYTGHLENLGANSSIEYILKKMKLKSNDSSGNLRIVLVRTKGLWGSSFSRADGGYPSIAKNLKKILPSLFLNLFFFGPRRKVEIEFYEPDDFPENTDRLTINKYLENFYNETVQKNLYVTYNWFEGFKPKILPEPQTNNFNTNISGVSSEIKNKILNYFSNLTTIKNITAKTNLSIDLGIDSIQLAEIMVWLEQEFNIVLEDMEAIQTVGDCILVASGEILSKKTEEIEKIDKSWFEKTDLEIEYINKSQNLAEIFKSMVKKYPDRIICADKNSGIKTYRDLAMGIAIFQKKFKAIIDERIGIMLPASAPTVISYLSLLFAGKIPVMVNWTVGPGQMKYSLSQTKTEHVISSRQLLHKLKRQGFDYLNTDIKWIFLEDIVKKLSKLEKIITFLKMRISLNFMDSSSVKDIAVILFTSGSEANPKSVPLTHKNIIANMQDILKRIDLSGGHTLLGMLPPFHSFGLTITTLLSISSGIKTVYYPNPTEAATLSKIIREYKVTMLAGTPTFMKGIMRCGQTEDFNSVKIVATGAEKCSETVYNSITEKCTNSVICEGYGITECSPVVSINSTENPEYGTIGKILPSIEYAILDTDTNKPVKKGKKGMLLVRGPSIFNGYLSENDKNPFVEYDNKKWYKTGDLVLENENGNIVFKGRLKRFIKIGGEMVSLPAIENVLNRQLANNDSDKGPILAAEELSLSGNSKIVLFTILDMKKNEANKYLKQAGFSNIYMIYKIIKLDNIPVLGTGKTDYRQLKKMLE